MKMIKMTYTREDNAVIWTGWMDADRSPADAFGRVIPPMYIRLYDGQVQAIINGGLVPIIIGEKLTLRIERDEE